MRLSPLLLLALPIAVRADCPVYPTLNLPSTLGIDGCLGNNLEAVFDTLLAPESTCSLTQVVSLTSSESISKVADLATKIIASPDKISSILYGFMTNTSATQVDTFCKDWGTIIAPCVQTLLPLILQIGNDDLECCGQVSDAVDLVNLVVPPTVSKQSFVLNEVVNGVNQALCSTRADTKQTCGASLFKQLTTKYTASNFRVVESFLLPFVSVASGQECNAFQGLSYTSSLSLQPTTALDYSCCVDGIRPLLESVTKGFEYVVTNAPLEWLNGIVEFPSNATSFVDSLAAAKSCKYKTTCAAPTGILSYPTTPVTPGTYDPKKNALVDTTCTKTKKCDAKGTTCSEVCAKGSVTLPTWVSQSLAYQRKLAYSGPLCYAQIPSTHNSAINLADGFGNRDQLMNLNLNPNKPYSFMKTNNHVLSLTDQLGVGVRWLEVDVHYFLKDLRTAHCGNLGSNSIQQLAATLKDELSKYGTVNWSADLLGCFPSLSGIKAEEQPTTRASLQDIRAWLDRPENQGELVFLYLDTGSELTTLGKTAQLNALVTEIFGDWTVPTSDWDALKAAGWTGSTATVQRFIDQGRRVVLLANDNTGVAYALGDFCKGHQVLQTSFINAVPDASRVLGGKKIYSGDYFLRSYQSVLHYISLSEAGELSQTLPVTFNAANVYNYVRWNLNLVATDALDGSMVKPQIWSWAESEPATTSANATVYVTSAGRWRASSTVARTKKACWNAATLKWSIVAFTVDCASGSTFAGPADPYQNWLLQQEITAQKITDAVVINAAVTN